MKTVIVTGASSGLGREFAEVLGKLPQVDEVWLVARRGDRLEELRSTIQAKVFPLSLDLSRFADLEKLRIALADRQPEVIALVNAAGYGRFGEVENVSLIIRSMNDKVSGLVNPGYSFIAFFVACKTALLTHRRA